MNYKLILLCSIIIILLILGFLFITREGFQTSSSTTVKVEEIPYILNQYTDKDKLNNFFKDCEECYNIQDSTQCKENKKCEWDDTKLDDQDHKCVPEGESRNYCNKYIDDNHNQELISTICPYNPNCLGKCIHMLTHTCGQYDSDSNTGRKKCILGNLSGYTHNKNKNGELKYDEYETVPIFNASRCLECVKNFYQITSLLKQPE